MTDDEQRDTAKAGEATKAVKSGRRATRRTSAHWAFATSMRKIRELLKIGLHGIEGEVDKIAKLEARLKLGEFSAKSDEALQKIADDPTQTFEVKKVAESNGDITLELSHSAAALLLIALRSSAYDRASLMFDLHSALCVYAWSAFEGYVQSVVFDIFVRHPHLMASAKTLTYEEALAARGDVVSYLAEKEVESIGRLGFRDLNTYLGRRLKASIPSNYNARMAGIYFLRNVIAHSAGRVRSDQVSGVPIGADVVDGQVRMSTKYLEGAVTCLDEATSVLDKHLDDKYFEIRGARPAALPPRQDA